MKIVSYNIHYAIGKDNKYDLDRIIDEIAGADIIALQEVERFYGPPHQPSQPEDIGELLKDYYWVYDAAFDVDGSESLSDGTVINRRRQHGQMLLSRWPIISKRYYPLPRTNIENTFNMQMGMIEGVIETPAGKLRIYNVHFGSVSSEERQCQAGFVLDLVRNAPLEGGAWTGPASTNFDRDWSCGMDQLPMPANAVVLGDFNMQSDSPEYKMLAKTVAEDEQILMDDVWLAQNPDHTVHTWHPNSGRPGDEKSARVDYCFITRELCKMVKSTWVDESARGSDHLPVWVEFSPG
jgi:endonuclease/exonuclease/phosphatase family metal-dependent hydrolase